MFDFHSKILNWKTRVNKFCMKIIEKRLMCLTCLRASVYQPWHEAIFFMLYTHLGHVYYVLHLYPGGWGWQWFVRWSSGRGMCEQVYCQFMNPLFKALWFRQIPEYPSVAHKHLKKAEIASLGVLLNFNLAPRVFRLFYQRWWPAERLG